MKNIFSIDFEIEQLLQEIQKDKKVLNTFSIAELEKIDKYLDDKHQYLKNNIGE